MRRQDGVGGNWEWENDQNTWHIRHSMIKCQENKRLV